MTATFASAFMTAFPDARFEFQAWVESGDTAAAEGAYSGTHTGTLVSPQGDIPATGKSVTITFAAVSKVRNGRVSYHHAYWDNAAFMMPLGLMAPPEAEPTFSRRILGCGVRRRSGRGHEDTAGSFRVARQ
jgi:hypothetical protein